MMQTGLLQKLVTTRPVGVDMVQDGADMRVILRPSCAGVIWRRTALPSFQRWVDALDPAVLPRARVLLPVARVRDALDDIFDVSGTPVSPERDRLGDDISALAEIFAEVMGVSAVRLRLDAVSHNACRKFHVDAMAARLVCTYRGPGTQYGLSPDGSDPSRIHTVPTGAPILLRGNLWPETPPSGLLHRSPPIEGTGQTRLVLVLDPVFDAEEEGGALPLD